MKDRLVSTQLEGRTLYTIHSIKPGGGVRPATETEIELFKQRDELLEALREAGEALMLTQEGSEFAACLPDEWSFAAYKDYERMRQAIAKINEALK